MTANLHTAWGELLLDSLAAAGVRQVVASPGSRSTPLVLAALGHERLTCRMVVDERSAGFVALGQARVTGTPSVLICTSGTAAAHYLPAVVEASESNLPLLLLTADRPPELHDRQALQSIRQYDLYGTFARAAFDLGTPGSAPEALAGLRQTAAVAVARTLDPRPGPVHLNAPFRKPLEPQVEDGGDAKVRDLVGRLESAPATAFAPPRRVPEPGVAGTLVDALRRSVRGLLLCGPGPVHQGAALAPLRMLAQRLGFPVVAEAASQFRFVAGDPLAPGPAELLCPSSSTPPELVPDLVLALGAPLTSPAWGRWLEREAAPRPWVLAQHGWNDPTNRAAGVVLGDLDLSLEALLVSLGDGEPRDPTWAPRWRTAEAVVRRVLAEEEADEAARGRWSEASAARAVVRAMPPESWLALGNSLTIREVDLACPGEGKALRVLSQRGVSGIDGGISGAAGAASVTGDPVVLLTGDLAFQHDLGGLATAATSATALVVVVINNGGGRIFELLPIAQGTVERERFERAFATPQTLDIAHAAAAFAIRHRGVSSGADLESALAEALARGGCTVVEARVPPTGQLERRRRLITAVRAGLTEAAG